MPQTFLQVQREYGIQTIFTSVCLQENPNAAIKLFHCWNCGRPVVQVKGDVVSMVPGEGDYRVAVIAKCSNPKCGIKYFFHSIARKM